MKVINGRVTTFTQKTRLANVSTHLRASVTASSMAIRSDRSSERASRKTRSWPLPIVPNMTPPRPKDVSGSSIWSRFNRKCTILRREISDTKPMHRFCSLNLASQLKSTAKKRWDFEIDRPPHLLSISLADTSSRHLTDTNANGFLGVCVSFSLCYFRCCIHKLSTMKIWEPLWNLPVKAFLKSLKLFDLTKK